jgi:hypothetical protein
MKTLEWYNNFGNTIFHYLGRVLYEKTMENVVRDIVFQFDFYIAGQCCKQEKSTKKDKNTTGD